MKALQDRWNGDIDHGKGLVSHNTSLLSAGQLLPPHVDTLITPSLPSAPFDVVQPPVPQIAPIKLQPLPRALAAPTQVVQGTMPGVVALRREVVRAAQAAQATVASTRTPKASTTAA